MIKDPSLREIIMLMIPVIILYGLYILFHGDYSSGGGFQSGVIISTAVILYALLFGPTISFKAFSLSLIHFIAVLGIFIYSAVGITTLIMGKEFLAYSVLLNDGVSGQKLGIFLVELGVTFTVGASMLIIYFNFAQRKD